MGAPKSTERSWLKECFNRGKADYLASVPVDQGPWAESDKAKDNRWQLGWRKEMARTSARRATGSIGMQGCCSSCRWWKGTGTTPHAECRGAPPSAALEGDAQVTLWPVTEAGDWCGGHRQRLPQQAHEITS